MVEPEIKKILESLKKADGSAYNLYADGLKIELSVNSRLQAHAEKAIDEHLAKLQTDFDKQWGERAPWGKSDSFLWAEAKKCRRYQRLVSAGKNETEIRANFNAKIKLLIYTNEGYKVREMSPLDSIAYHQRLLQAGFLAMDVSSGDVLAYVGGIDFGHFPYDHIYAKRQVGSTFKPFVYATALEAGFSPCDYVENERIVFSDFDDWSPENADGKYGGYYTLKGGLTFSVNTVAAQLMSETGAEAVVELAKRAGIKSKLPNLPSIALGVASCSLEEMVTAYSAFASKGLRVNPVIIKRILNAENEELYKSAAATKRQVFDLSVASNMRGMLESAVDSGTARSLRSKYAIRAPLGAKTGTTQNNADGWLMAISPKVVCGAWVGAQSPIVHFKTTALGQGAATALPIVGKWMYAIEHDTELPNILGRSFPEMSEEEYASLDCPLYVEKRIDGFFQSIFGSYGDTNDEKDESGEDDSNGSWMKNLLDKLKKQE